VALASEIELTRVSPDSRPRLRFRLRAPDALRQWSGQVDDIPPYAASE
jgi:hypothetical protein